MQCQKEKIYNFYLVKVFFFFFAEKIEEKELIPYFQLAHQENLHDAITYYVLQVYVVILVEQLPYPFVLSSHALTVYHDPQ